MSERAYSHRQTVIVLKERAAEPEYHSLEAAAELTGVAPDQLRQYHRSGLLSQPHATADGRPVFDDHAIYEVRRIEHLRRAHGVPLSALPLVCELLNEVEQLRAETRFLRDL